MSENKSIVIKLGGTSQCKIAYDNLIKYIQHLISESYIVYVVLSAVSGVTNLLDKYTKTKDYTHIIDVLELNEKLIDELFSSNEYSFNPDKPQSLLDEFEQQLKLMCESYTDLDDIYAKSKIIGYGEMMSTKIFHYYFESNKKREISSKVDNVDNIDKIEDNSILLNSYDYIKTSKEIYDLYPSVEFTCNKIPNQYKNVFILQGFIASDINNNPTLLGRGGSDTTGSLVANRVEAKRYEVWTDVDGIYTADPRISNSVEKIKNISYEMCKEIASLGAKVMHPLSILPCEIKLIPIIVKSSFSDSDGTVISNFNDSKKIIAIQNDVTLFNIRSENMWNAYGFVTDIFRKFSELHIDISIITTSQFSISTTTNEKNIYQLNKVYQKLKSKYECEMTNGCTVISIISDNIFDKISKLNFDKLEPEIIHIGSNNLSVNLVFKNKTKNNIKEIINSI
jgi:aspartate kinase